MIIVTICPDCHSLWKIMKDYHIMGMKDYPILWSIIYHMGLSQMINVTHEWYKIIYHITYWLIEGSLEVKLPTIWTDGKAGVERVREEKKKRSEKRKRKSQKKEDAGARKGRNGETLCFFQWFVDLAGRKIGSLFGGCRASWPDERWKIAHRCGAKHISKSKCTKHLSIGARLDTFKLLEVEMSRQCTPLWREARSQVNMYTKHTMLGALLEVVMSKKCTPWWRKAHFQAKMYKAHHARNTFGSWDVEKVYTVVARSRFPSQNVKSTTCLGWLLKIQMWFCVAGAKDSAPCQKWTKREGFVTFSKTMAGVGHLKRIWKDAFFVAGAVQETCSSEMLGGQGADFLRRGLHFGATDLQVC